MPSWPFTKLSICKAGHLQGWPFAKLAICKAGYLQSLPSAKMVTWQRWSLEKLVTGKAGHRQNWPPAKFGTFKLVQLTNSRFDNFQISIHLDDELGMLKYKYLYCSGHYLNFFQYII